MDHRDEGRRQAELVRAWREVGNREDADQLVTSLGPGIAELASAVGLLYAEDQAVQAIRAALQVANPRASSVLWRRRRRARDVAPEDWAEAPLATLMALCTHAVLDLAHVPALDRVSGRVSTAHHAVMRLQVADVLDADEAAHLLGVSLRELEALTRRVDAEG